jgi:hypothetical protein
MGLGATTVSLGSAMFQNLQPLQLNQAGDYTPIPLAGAGGVVAIRIPAFPAGQTGIYEIGIYEGENTAPGFVEQRRVSLVPYARFLNFQIPPSLTNPQLGLRLIQKADLATYDEAITASFHMPPAVSTGDGPVTVTEWDFFDQLPA